MSKDISTWQKRNVGICKCSQLSSNLYGRSRTSVPRPLTAKANPRTSSPTTSMCRCWSRVAPGIVIEHVIVGTAGNDILPGTPGNGLILGLEGDDKIHGRGGDDCLRRLRILILAAQASAWGEAFRLPRFSLTRLLFPCPTAHPDPSPPRYAVGPQVCHGFRLTTPGESSITTITTSRSTSSVDEQSTLKQRERERDGDVSV
jgi:Ca2+-binding RTX toxin-like protein